MYKSLFISLFLIVNLYAIDVPIEKVEMHGFGKSVDLNSKIIQLSSNKQSIMALLDGRIKEYFVKVGDRIEKGQKIALIESIELSKMTSEYVSLKNQYLSLNQNYNANKKLYKKGIVSLETLNTVSMQKNEMLARIETLKSQLKTLGLNPKKIKSTTSKYILYAFNDGTISELIQPKQAVVSKDTEIISVIKEKSFYLKSYLPLLYAKDLKVGQKISFNFNGENLVTYINQILPELDEETQRIVVLSSIDESINGLFVNSYVTSTLYFNIDKKYIAVKKTALSFFNNEWVVFLPKEEYEDSHDDEKKDGDNEEHEEQQFEARDVKIIEQNNEYVAIEGLNIGEEYVSDKSYFVKSMVLKSSLGGHGH